MRKLTASDIKELTEFFTANAPQGAATGLAAQTYEPGGGSAYTPVTDTRLVRLCVAAKALSRSDWARTKRVIDQMLDAPGGDVHVLTLRLACSDPRAGWPEIACRTPVAMCHGRRVAEAEAHHVQLDGVYRAARDAGQSGMTTAMRVLAADRRLYLTGVRVHDEVARVVARGLIAAGKVDLEEVGRQTDEVVDSAASALKVARDAVGASKRAQRAAEDKRRADFRAYLRAEREAKEAERFDARLRRTA